MSLIRFLLLLLCAILPLQNYGQGKVLFSNRVPGLVDAPVRDWDGKGIGSSLGEGIIAQLFLVGPGGTLTPLEPITTFRQTPQAATPYIHPVTVTIPKASAGQHVTLRMMVFRKNYDTGNVIGLDGLNTQFSGSDLEHLGNSSDLTVTLGTDSSPAPLLGLLGFSGIGPLTWSFPHDDYVPHYTNWELDYSFQPELPENAELISLFGETNGVRVLFKSGDLTNHWKLHANGQRDISFPNTLPEVIADSLIYSNSPSVNGEIFSKAQYTRPYSYITNNPSFAKIDYNRVSFEAFGGRFTSVDGKPQVGYALFHQHGFVDWTSGVNWQQEGIFPLGGTNDVQVYSVGFDKGAGLFLLGNFTTLNNKPINYLGRVTHLAADPRFNPIKTIDAIPTKMVVTNDVVYIGGPFTEINGHRFNHVARVAPAAKFHFKPNGTMGFSLPSTNAILERSTNLVTWEAYSTLSNTNTMTNTFIRMNSFTFPTNGFFRIRVD